MPSDELDSFETRATGRAAGGEPATRSDATTIAVLQQRLDDLSAQLGRLTRAPAEEAPPARSRLNDEDVNATLRAIEGRLSALGKPQSAQPNAMHQLSEALMRVDNRLDRLVSEGRSATNELERRIASVDRALDRLGHDRAESTLRDDTRARMNAAGNWAGSFDLAVEEILERQRTLDADPEAPGAEWPAPHPWRQPPSNTPDVSGSPFSALQNQLRALTDELHTFRRPGGFEDAVRGLREELAEVGRALAEAAPRGALQALEAEVRALASRLDHSRESGESPALAGLEESLAEIRETLRAFAPAESLAAFREEVRALDRRIEMVGQHGADSDALLQLGRSVAELRDIASQAASSAALGALNAKVEQLSERLERVSGPASFDNEILTTLDRRFETLAADLQALGPAARAAIPDNLVSVVETLAAKLDRLELSGDSTPTLDAIAAQMGRLSERLEASPPGTANLEHMERSFANLLDRLDGLREEAVSAAENAARALVSRAGAGGVIVDSLKQDIDSLRETQVQSERRTQDTLEAVHDTLERLVDRLANLEGDLRGPDAAPVSGGHGLRLREHAYQNSIVPDESPPEAPRRETRMGSGAATVVAERRPIDPSLPADHPLEPGAIRNRAPGNAADRIAASEAALGAAKPAPDQDAKANFIAAARRAAQAAANMSPPPDSEAAASEQSAFGAMAQALSRRRPLLLGLAILAIAGTLHLVVNVWAVGDTKRAQSARPAADSSNAVASISGQAKPQASQPGAASDGAQSATATAPASEPPVKADTAKAGERDPVSEASATPESVEAPAGAARVTADTALAAAAVPAAPATAPAVGPGAPVASSPTIPAAGTTSASVPLPSATAGVSPLTIASMQLPGRDTTGAIGRSGGAGRKGDVAGMPLAITPTGAPQGASAIPAGLRAAAAAGNPAAEFELGARYAEGRGVQPNLEEAARWFERAANREIAPAQYRLGSLYEKGQGVKKDIEQARRLYRAAAEKGNGKAMHNLAVLYAEGIDGKPDFTQASRWFRPAAQRGIADSQYNLGILHARGLGVEQNLSEAYKWFALAAQQGDVDAGKKRDEIGGRLDQRLMAAATVAVQTFTAEPQPEEAIAVKAPAGGWDAPAQAQPPSSKPKTAAPRRVGP
jgi:localization factor PodJL